MKLPTTFKSNNLHTKGDHLMLVAMTQLSDRIEKAVLLNRESDRELNPCHFLGGFSVEWYLEKFLLLNLCGMISEIILDIVFR